jgi:REP-associated tyrosine transposase
VLNPVPAAIVKYPQQWPWNGYGAMTAKFAAPTWLTTDVLLAEFGKSRLRARRKYQQFVEEGIGGERIWKNLKGQIYLGDDHFVEQMRGKLGEREEHVNISRLQQRVPAPTLTVIHRQYSNRDQGIRAAYETGAYNYQQIADHFGVYFTMAGRIVRKSAQRVRGTRAEN